MPSIEDLELHGEINVSKRPKDWLNGLDPVKQEDHIEYITVEGRNDREQENVDGVRKGIFPAINQQVDQTVVF